MREGRSDDYQNGVIDYIRTIDIDELHSIRAGAKHAMFVYRQGENDIKFVNKKFELEELLRYGYIEDLGYNALDKSGAGQKNKLFPAHEMMLVMKDGKRYHVNAGFYNPKQLKEIVDQLVENTGVHPTGALAKETGVEPAPKAAE